MQPSLTLELGQKLTAIPIGSLEIGTRLVIQTACRRPFRFTVTGHSTSDARVIAVGELGGGIYASPRRAALVGGEHTNGVDASALVVGDGAVFLVDPVSGRYADRIVTTPVSELRVDPVSAAA